MSDDHSSNWGGARKGAGRPRVHPLPVVVELNQWEWEMLRIAVEGVHITKDQKKLKTTLDKLKMLVK